MLDERKRTATHRGCPILVRVLCETEPSLSEVEGVGILTFIATGFSMAQPADQFLSSHSAIGTNLIRFLEPILM
jgi:hypothetical protein